MKIFSDDKAVTVIFGTLVIILVTITVASTFLYLWSLEAQKNYERQSEIDAANNENLTIISIKPYENESIPGYWTGFDFTILNRDIHNAGISSITVNDKVMSKWVLYDKSGGLELDNSTPNILHHLNFIDVPDGQTVKVHVGAVNYQKKEINDNDEFNNSLPNHIYDEMSSSGWMNVTSSSTNSPLEDSFFYVDNNTITAPDLDQSSITYNCNVNYTVFPGNEPYNVSSPNPDFNKTQPIKVDILTQRTNVFSRVFSPPIPIANAQYQSELMPDGTYKAYIVLDASGSTAPNGFLTKYEWDIWGINANCTPLYGIKQQFPYETGKSYTIDLTVIDNYGMYADLSKHAGNITI